MKRSDCSLTTYGLRITTKNAFTLVELSIVILFIGVMIVGIVGASGMIRSAVISSARTFTVKSVVPQIDGLVAWYETSMKESFLAAEGYDTAQISTWYDISPGSLLGTASEHKNILTKTASSGVTYVADGINNLPSILITNTSTDSKKDSSNKFALADFYQGSLTQATIFVVARPAALASSFGRIIVDSGHTDTVFAVGMGSNTTMYINAGSAANTGTGSNSASFAIGQDYIATYYVNNSNSKAYLNNATTSAGNANIDSGTNLLSGLTVGSDRNGYYGFQGLISEIIIYNRVLPIQERRDVMKYLSYKYKISVTGI